MTCKKTTWFEACAGLLFLAIFLAVVVYLQSRKDQRPKLAPREPVEDSIVEKFGEPTLAPPEPR